MVLIMVYLLLQVTGIMIETDMTKNMIEVRMSMLESRFDYKTCVCVIIGTC